ncbi:hypothetical protein [Streptomyces sp. TLI_053]|uniref:hypothetical protein n=1 Tax=Streptomyces sp. TLI_053 TaxID=1855352 RepID=UPI000B809E03|nr:hypothetical protein [Streptomyces sp. TLI_053]
MLSDSVVGAMVPVSRAPAELVSGGTDAGSGDGAAGMAFQRAVTVARGQTALRLGRSRLAARHFDRFTDSLSAVGAVPSPQTAVWLLDVVEARLALGEIDGAVRAVRRAVDILGTVPPGLTAKFRQRMAGYGSEPAVRQAVELLRDSVS